MKHFLVLLILLSAITAQAADTRVLIVVGPSNHPPGSHEVAAGGRVLKHCVENMANLPGIKADLVEGWPDAAQREAAEGIQTTLPDLTTFNPAALEYTPLPPKTKQAN